MCGIAGYMTLDGAPVDREVLGRMAAALRHRGPDGDGVTVVDNLGLAHRRLAIIDLDGGAQPMRSADGHRWISFNGEIYNYVELRRELAGRGHTFHTHSDTETILGAYADAGLDGIRRLRGMFAFALYDAWARELVLARDRFGIKPLYYFDDGRVLAFASELKALLMHPAVPRQIDAAAVSDYLTNLYVPAPRSIFRGIGKLPPGSCLIVRGGRTRLQRYWHESFAAPGEGEPPPGHAMANPGASEHEWAERVREALAESVRLHMRSDVPYGALLSGGLDSSSIVALMAQHSGAPIRTYTVGFEEAAFDERRYARQVAERYGTAHTEIVLRPDGLAVLPQLVRQFDEPFADASAVPCLHIAQVVGRDLKVCLTGDGGDEAFGGYHAYRLALGYRTLDRFPAAARRTLLDALLRAYPEWLAGRGRVRLARLPFAERYAELMGGFDQPLKQRLMTPDLAAAAGAHDSYDRYRALLGEGHGDPLSLMQATDYETYLPDDILVKVDRTSMLQSLEMRVPFIDSEVFEVARRVPPALRLHDGQGKYILRQAMRDLLPRANRTRGKQGFGVPLQRWLGGDLGAFAVEVFTDRRTAQRGLLCVPELLTLVRRHRAGRPRTLDQIWAALMLELWCREYVDGGAAQCGTPADHLNDRTPRQPSPGTGEGMGEGDEMASSHRWSARAMKDNGGGLRPQSSNPPHPSPLPFRERESASRPLEKRTPPSSHAARPLVNGAACVAAALGVPRLVTRLRHWRGQAPRAFVFMYHRVSDDADYLGLTVPAAIFERQVTRLCRRMSVRPLRELVARLAAGGPLDGDAAAITFDDGYRDNLEIALPILERLGAPATVFVATGFVDGTARPTGDRLRLAVEALWQRGAGAAAWSAGDDALDRLVRGALAAPGSLPHLRSLREALKGVPGTRAEGILSGLDELADAHGCREPLMLDWEGVRTLARRGVEIGSHTVSHGILSRLPRPRAERELLESKRRLEAEIEQPVVGFAFPNGRAGDYTPADVAALERLGYAYACTAEWGANGLGCDAYQLRRIGVGRDSDALLDLKLALAGMRSAA